MQVNAWYGVAQFEGAAVREWLAPKKPVVTPKGRAVGVGIPAEGIGSKVERYVDPFAFHIR